MKGRKARQDTDLTERDFAQNVVALAALLGWRVYRTWNSRHSPKGWPDLVLCQPPQLICAELKSGTGTLSTAQGGWLEDLGACGVETHVWRPEDMEAIAHRLQQRRGVPPRLPQAGHAAPHETG